MARHQDWGGFGQWNGDHADGPGGVIADGVGHIVHQTTRESFEALVQETEGDGVWRLSGDSPIPLIIAHSTAVECILTVMLICGDVVGLVVEHKCSIFNAIRIPSNYSTKVGVIVFGVIEVLLAGVVTTYNVLHDAIAVRDLESSETGTVGNERSGDVGGRDIVDGERVG